MEVYKINTGHGQIYIAGDDVNEGHDFFVEANAPLNTVEVVLFFDSRGISRCWNDSLLKMLLEHFKSINYLVVARPLELTTWATLYNFLSLNALCPDLLITNVGLVDFTPKKYALCQSMVEQVMFASEEGNAAIHPLGRYPLSNGQNEMLFSVDYSEKYKLQLKNFFFEIPTIAIKTPLVDPCIRVDRKRPDSFFTQLQKTNEFIDGLGCSSIDLGYFDCQLTYDAVHWTHDGNKLVFNKIISQL